MSPAPPASHNALSAIPSRLFGQRSSKSRRGSRRRDFRPSPLGIYSFTADMLHNLATTNEQESEQSTVGPERRSPRATRRRPSFRATNTYTKQPLQKSFIIRRLHSALDNAKTTMTENRKHIDMLNKLTHARLDDLFSDFKELQQECVELDHLVEEMRRLGEALWGA